MTSQPLSQKAHYNMLYKIEYFIDEHHTLAVLAQKALHYLNVAYKS